MPSRRNRIEIEDKAGMERVTLSTPYANTMIRMGSPNPDKELIMKTDLNALLETGENWDVSVGGRLTEFVKGTVSETYASNKTETVSLAVAEQYGGHETLVKGTRSADYQLYKLLVHGTSNETHAGDHTTQSWAARTIEVGGAHTETSHSGRTTTVIGNWSQTITGVSSWFKTDAHVGVTLGATTDTFLGVKNSNTVGASASFALSANFSATCSADLKLAMGVEAKFGAPVDLRASGIKVTKCDDWSVVSSATAKIFATEITFVAAGPIIMA
jgi:type VI secretion system secreted protein VgrG